MGCSLHNISLNIPPIMPVITPIKLATSQGAPDISATRVPAIAKVASPAASGIRKNLCGMANRRAVIKIMIALSNEATKKSDWQSRIHYDQVAYHAGSHRPGQWLLQS